jgi:hypothetical protein
MSKSAVSRRSSWRREAVRTSDGGRSSRAQAPLKTWAATARCLEDCRDEQICCKNEVWLSLGGSSKHMAQLRLCTALACAHWITGSLATRPVSDAAPHCVLASGINDIQWGATKRPASRLRSAQTPASRHSRGVVAESLTGSV